MTAKEKITCGICGTEGEINEIYHDAEERIEREFTCEFCKTFFRAINRYLGYLVKEGKKVTKLLEKKRIV